MGDKTGIEWTDASWNPVTGCTKVSAGCKYCYAEDVAERFWEKQYPPIVDGAGAAIQSAVDYADRRARASCRI